MNTFDMKNNRIGIIGYGQFGQLLHDLFLKVLPSVKIMIFSRGKKTEGTVFYDLETVVRTADVIIPTVPINQFENVIKQIAPLMSQGKILIDVCSVKEYPVKIMKELISSDVNIIATHPLFGPKSWSGAGNKIVMHKVQGEENVYNSAKKLFLTLGLTIIEMNPKEHDELQAKSQFFVQTVRSLAQSLHLEKTSIDTPSAALIFEGLNAMGNSHELYLDMIRYNHHCREVIKKMKVAISRLDY